MLTELKEIEDEERIEKLRQTVFESGLFDTLSEVYESHLELDVEEVDDIAYLKGGGEEHMTFIHEKKGIQYRLEMRVGQKGIVNGRINVSVPWKNRSVETPTDPAVSNEE